MLTTPATFPALTGLRFMAALLVCVHHFTPAWLPVFLYDVLQEWHVGVTVFFVLSGFLICHRYYNSFELKSIWFKKYIVNRIARIYPMYFILTSITFLFSNESFKIYLLNITFLRGFFQNYFQTGISQGWSLTVEEVFYVCAPFIFFFSKKGWLWLQPVVLIASGLLITIYFNDIKTAYGFFGSYRFTFLYTFFGRCFEFFAGIQLALWMHSTGQPRQFKISFTYTGLLLILLTTVLLSLIRGNEKYGLHTDFGIAINNFALPVFVCFLIYGLIAERSFISRFLSTSALQLLGKSSYCFYLIHLGLLHTLFTTHISSHFFIELLFMIGASVLLFKCIEEPMNKKIRQMVTV